MDEEGINPVAASIFTVGTLEEMEAYHLAHPEQHREAKPNRLTPEPKGIDGAKLKKRPILVPPYEEAAPPSTPDVSDESGQPRAPALGASFIGIIDNNTLIPPDTTGTVGPNHVFEFLNTGRTIFNKSGGVVASFITLQSFWSALGTGSGQPANSLSDPRVQYDHYTDRWIVSVVGFGSNRWVLVGISQTSNPAGAYNLFAIQVNTSANGFNHNGHLMDFNLTGFDPNNVIFTGNVFTNGGFFVHSDVYIFEKAKLMAGGALVHNVDFRIVHNPCGSPNNLGNINYAPCITYGQTPGTAVNYVIDTGWYDVNNSNIRYFRVGRITGTGASAVYDCMNDENFVVTTSCYNFRISNASQPNGCNAITVNGPSIDSPGVVRNGKIWFTHNVGADIPGCASPGSNPAPTRAEIVWVQQDPANIIFPGTPDQFGRISNPVQAYYYPSIAVNRCDAAMIGFTGSGPNTGQFASGMYTARLATDPPNTMQSVGVIKAGENTYNKTFGSGRNRWGDYSATCVDPADDSTMWTLQEYARPPSGSACGADTGRWGTWWASMPMECCPTININPATLPGATIGSSYSQTLTASAGTPSFNFTVIAGALPPGLSLSSGGVLSGTPSSTVGSFNFTVGVTDSQACGGTRAYTVPVVCSLPGDVNLDGEVNGLDIQHWTDCAVIGSSPAGYCGCADMNADGITNLSDRPAFVNALLGP